MKLILIVLLNLAIISSVSAQMQDRFDELSAFSETHKSIVTETTQEGNYGSFRIDKSVVKGDTFYIVQTPNIPFNKNFNIEDNNPRVKFELKKEVVHDYEGLFQMPRIWIGSLGHLDILFVRGTFPTKVIDYVVVVDTETNKAQFLTLPGSKIVKITALENEVLIEQMIGARHNIEYARFFSIVDSKNGTLKIETYSRIIEIK